ncbi:hypothetical protein PVL29_018421 [Vitis rotundifolia]|uniref:Uncharacterized protein n=1 Tax=Vitis rotundifolia TaxID=103349 RepID=A0AA39DG70_VITRO|nr:hypothetical protein PVL29_018421 [Vitis rotundifolia]
MPPSRTPSPTVLAAMYSEVQTSRLNRSLPLPSVLKSLFKIVYSPLSSVTGNPGEIADEPTSSSYKKLKVGIALSSGQASKDTM